ncbi:translesion error-prone DNA polymerase V autoproteolytic subunit [Crenobacter sp. SG2305]|uniref:LexA family protein n=1 Tax=Crenobacter oryzisoli TaxID=3056844 RepID=UPI0025AAEC4D|nr:translesion error-prone DNA polymerase V autoproteolytic subunit [Crenobacter sp. SG2305]MDN0084659.1 translesion error-prone DNA polymerase V autoproteolytic subunit [Crenobacter sp. SG2305]
MPTLPLDRAAARGLPILLPNPDAPRLALPLFASPVRCGFPSPADDYLDARLDLNQYLVEDVPATFMIRVQGDSMIGAHLVDGDVLVVDKGRQPCVGDIVVAAVDGEFTVKRLARRGSRFYLHPENPAYPPIVPADGQELLIWGVVVGSVRKF